MRVIHVFRTPVGGLFRHVRDLVRGHQALGIKSGVICDSTTGGEGAAALLKTIEPYCELGVTRIPISRLPGFGDIGGAHSVSKVSKTIEPDIIHGHGAKGGLYGRLAAKRLGIPSIYSAHGGSLHYQWGLSPGTVFLAAETHLRRIGSGLIFVCEFEKRAFDAKIGIGGKPFKIIYNGLWPEEVSQVAPGPADIVYVGEMRKLKGVDVLLRAIGAIREARPITAIIAGGGEDRALFESLAREMKLDDCVSFTGPLPARKAFAMGKLFVMPSRAESFPYVILEAAAAGMPIVASAIGGIPEVLPPGSLVPADNVAALTDAIRRRLNTPALLVSEGRENMARVADRFDAARMCRDIAGFYGELTHSAPAD